MVLILFVLSFGLALGVSYAMGRICQRRFGTDPEPILREKSQPADRKIFAACRGGRWRVVRHADPIDGRLCRGAVVEPARSGRATHAGILGRGALSHVRRQLAGNSVAVLILGLLFATPLIVLRRSNTSLKWLRSEQERTRETEANGPVVPTR